METPDRTTLPGSIILSGRELGALTSSTGRAKAGPTNLTPGPRATNTLLSTQQLPGLPG